MARSFFPLVTVTRHWSLHFQASILMSPGFQGSTEIFLVVDVLPGRGRLVHRRLMILDAQPDLAVFGSTLLTTAVTASPTANRSEAALTRFWLSSEI